MIWVEQFFLALGILFAVLGSLGALFLPDVYTRLQASSTCSTTSVFSFFVAGIVRYGLAPISGKIFVIALFFMVSSPIAAQIIARYAWNKGMVPWRKFNRTEQAGNDD